MFKKYLLDKSSFEIVILKWVCMSRRGMDVPDCSQKCQTDSFGFHIFRSDGTQVVGVPIAKERSALFTWIYDERPSVYRTVSNDQVNEVRGMQTMIIIMGNLKYINILTFHSELSCYQHPSLELRLAP